MNHHFPYRSLTVSSIDEEERTSPPPYASSSSSLSTLCLRIDVDAASNRTIITSDDDVIKLRPWQMFPTAAIVIKPSDDDDDNDDGDDDDDDDDDDDVEKEHHDERIQKHGHHQNKITKEEYDDDTKEEEEEKNYHRSVLPRFAIPESVHEGYRNPSLTTTTRWCLRIDGDDTTEHTTTSSHPMTNDDHHHVMTSQQRPWKLLMRNASSVSVTSNDDGMNQEEGINMNDHVALVIPKYDDDDDDDSCGANMIPITPSPRRCIHSADHDDKQNMWWLSTSPPPPLVPSPSLIHYHQIPSSLDRCYPQLLLPHL